MSMSMKFDCQAASSAIVRLCDIDGCTLGTGFIVTQDGHLLTCYHVVHHEETIFADKEGNLLPVNLISSLSSPECDIAVLKMRPISCAVPPLQTEWSLGEDVWTSGFHREGDGIKGAFPTSGKIEGEVQELTYSCVDPCDKEYTLHNLLKISLVDIDEGLSGAPLFSISTGAVIGMINGDYNPRVNVKKNNKREGYRLRSGFALPFTEAEVSKLPLCGLLDQNRKTIPRRTPYLNHVAARAISKTHVSAELERLAETKQFLADLYCDRENARIDNILTMTAKIIPIIGSSGVGKTTLLAKTAEACTESHVVIFCRAKFLDFNTPGLKSYVNQVFGYEPCTSSALEGLWPELVERKESLIVFLDALNESTASLPETRSWLERSYAWLCKHPVRLIVTSRPEYWSAVEDIFDQDPFYPRRGGSEENGSFIRLGGYTSSEAEEALRKYGLSSMLVREPSLRHPFLMRLYAELRGGVEAKNPMNHVGYYSLFNKFIQHKCRNIVIRLGATGDSAYVNYTLEQLALELTKSQERFIKNEDYWRIVSDDRLRSAICTENLLEEVRGGYQFVFDEIGEILIARRLDANSIADWNARITKGDSTTLGVLGFELLKIERESPGQLTSILLAMIQSSFQREPGPLEDLLFQTFKRLEHPENFTSCLMDFTARGSRYLRNDFILGLEFRVLVNFLRVRPAEKLAWLRILAIGENGEYWQWSYWIDLDFDEFEKSYLDREDPCPELCLLHHVHEVVQADPTSAISGLLEWLDDECPLSDFSGGESSFHVSDIAAALLFQYCSRFPDLVFSGLLKKAAAGAGGVGSKNWLLLSRLADKDCSSLISALEVCTKSGGRTYAKTVVEVICRMNLGQQSEQIQARAEKLLESASTNGVLAEQGLVKIPWRTKEMLVRMGEQLYAGTSEIRPAEFEEYIHNHCELVFSIFERCLLGDASHYVKESCLEVLSRQENLTHQQYARIVALTKQCLLCDNSLAINMSYRVESLLLRIPAGTEAYNETLSLAMYLIKCPGSYVGPLIYYAHYAIKNLDKRDDQQKLINLLVDCPEKHSYQFLELMLQHCTDFEKTLPLAVRIAESLDGHKYGDTLFKGIFHASETFKESMAPWIRSQDTQLFGGRLSALHSKVNTGLTVQEALATIVDESL